MRHEWTGHAANAGETRPTLVAKAHRRAKIVYKNQAARGRQARCEVCIVLGMCGDATGVPFKAKTVAQRQPATLAAGKGRMEHAPYSLLTPQSSKKVLRRLISADQLHRNRVSRGPSSTTSCSRRR